jgi:hypothetical protein
MLGEILLCRDTSINIRRKYYEFSLEYVHCVSNFIVLYGELHHLMLCNIQNADTLICSVAKIKHGKYENELNESPQSVITYMFGVWMILSKGILSLLSIVTPFQQPTRMPIP